MIAVHDLLKVDPYNSVKGDPYYIDKNVFYNGVYAEPSSYLLKKAERSVNSGNNAIRLFHINGYAGCGKTLFAHYLINKYGYSDDYNYSFDHGEGRDYSLEFVKTKILKQLFRHVSRVVKNKKTVLDKFIEIGRSIFGEGKDYELFSAFIYDEQWQVTVYKGLKIQMTWLQISAIIEDAVTVLFSNILYDVNDKIKFLLLCDYYWRCAEVISSDYNTEERVVFCLLDNLDNLHTDAAVDLFLDINDVLRNLNEARIDFEEHEVGVVSHIKYIYLFSTREITYQRLLDELRRRGQATLFSNHNTVFPFDLENNVASLDCIIRSRKEYWAKRAEKSEVNKIEVIEELMSIPFIQKQFSDLLNDNYSYAVDRILDLWNDMPEFVSECKEMQSDNRYGDDYLRCSQEGTRGILLRMLLELFKMRNVYDSVTDMDAEFNFNVNGKLGLNDLTVRGGSVSQNVSISRLLLTFIKESTNGRTRINHIFQCFSDVDGKEICRYLFALSENIRDTWRRLLVFSANVPSSVGDLYKQYDQFSANPSLSSSLFTEVEICLAGKTYIYSIVPNFEFYLSRIGKSADIQIHPPLFSKKSLLARQNGEWEFAKTIESVVEIIESCANSLYQYDADLLQRCVSQKNDYVDCLFVSRSNGETKQSHLSRIVFSHISYLERFRRYYLYSLTQGSENQLSESPRLINKFIISCIVRYLMLFDNEPFLGRFSSLISDNPFLPRNYVKDAFSRKSCKDIVDLVKSKSVISSYRKISEKLELGYQNQKKAQMQLLYKIRLIEAKNYEVISKIEIRQREI